MTIHPDLIALLRAASHGTVVELYEIVAELDRFNEGSSLERRAIKCQRRPSVEHRCISFSVVEMSFPRGWKWTVGKGKTVTVGVCATRLDAIRQAQTFIDAVIDWAA